MSIFLFLIILCNTLLFPIVHYKSNASTLSLNNKFGSIHTNFYNHMISLPKLLPHHKLARKNDVAIDIQRDDGCQFLSLLPELKKIILAHFYKISGYAYSTLLKAYYLQHCDSDSLSSKALLIDKLFLSTDESNLKKLLNFKVDLMKPDGDVNNFLDHSGTTFGSGRAFVHRWETDEIKLNDAVTEKHNEIARDYFDYLHWPAGRKRSCSEVMQANKLLNSRELDLFMEDYFDSIKTKFFQVKRNRHWDFKLDRQHIINYRKKIVDNKIEFFCKRPEILCSIHWWSSNNHEEFHGETFLYDAKTGKRENLGCLDGQYRQCKRIRFTQLNAHDFNKLLLIGLACQWLEKENSSLIEGHAIIAMLKDPQIVLNKYELIARTITVQHGNIFKRIYNKIQKDYTEQLATLD